MDIKNYDLQLINQYIKKIKYYGRGVSMYIFDYKDFKLAKKLIEEKNAIYLIKTSKNSSEIYVGQTTKGPERFFDHKMKEHISNAEIYYLVFDNRPSRNILDALERRLIEIIEIEGYITKNSNKGVFTDIGDREEQFIDENIITIRNLLLVFGINIGNIDSTREVRLVVEKSGKVEVKKDFAETFYYKDGSVNLSIKREPADSQGKGKWILTKGSVVLSQKWWDKYSDKPETETYNFYKNFINLISDDGVVKEDIEWNSISPLTAFAKGISANNGWTSIKNKSGKTPDDLYRK